MRYVQVFLTLSTSMNRVICKAGLRVRLDQQLIALLVAGGVGASCQLL